MNGQSLSEFRRRLIRSIEIVFWIAAIGTALIAWFLPLSPLDQRHLLYLTMAAAGFSLILFRGLIPKFGAGKISSYLMSIGAVIFTTCSAYLLDPYGMRVEILYVGAIAGLGLLSGMAAAVCTTLFSASAWAGLYFLRGSVTLVGLATLSMQTLVVLLVGCLISSLAGLLHRQLHISEQQNRDLSILLHADQIISKYENLRTALFSIAELLAKNIPSTSCRISLLTPGNDSLETYGAYPLKHLQGWTTGIGISYPLSTLPLHQEALKTGKPLILHDLDSEASLSKEEKANFFFEDVKTICLVPLIAKGKRFGVISIGEARTWERAPFSPDKVNLLQSLASQVSGLIYNVQLYQESLRHGEHLAVLNRVASAIGSTLDLNRLLEQIYTQLSTVIPSDTYFVSLYNPKQESMEVRILIDNGQRYSPAIVPLGEGLSSWVIENKKPLLIRHLSRQIKALSIKPISLGNERASESWLGVPILLGDEVLGLLALASYKPGAFDNEDLVLLSNVASQAALAIDNARKHTELQEQAIRDSLTGAYNHGHLLQRLHEEVEFAKQRGGRVSLIMLDIDYFKVYNDTYGHQAGDRLLCMLVKTIQAHVKKSDIVGRWGGEEFAIALPGATSSQALMVAERIRRKLAEIELSDKEGNPIPKPTVSQGIATFPDDVKDESELVDVADEALYIAKQRGRDQIMVALKGEALQVHASVDAK